MTYILYIIPFFLDIFIKLKRYFVDTEDITLFIASLIKHHEAYYLPIYLRILV